MLSHFPKKLFEREPKPVETPPQDAYLAAARALGVSLDSVHHGRKAKDIAARWGVWMALRDGGWSYTKIAERSTEKSWNHTTVMSAMRSIEDMSAAAWPTLTQQARLKWTSAAKAATVRERKKT